MTEGDEIYIPVPDDFDPDDADRMQQGKRPPDVEGDHENDLRDPWFHTTEGMAWLAERGDG